MTTFPPQSLRAALTLLLLSVVFALMFAGASQAAAPRVIIAAPAKSAVIAGRQSVRIRLGVGRRTRVRRARFYFQGVRIGTDRKAPFVTKDGTTIDTAALPVGKQVVKFAIKYSARRKGGKVVRRTVEKNLLVEVFRPPTDLQSLPPNWATAFNDDFSAPSVSASNWKTQRDDWIKGGRPYSNLEGAGYLGSNVSVASGMLSLRTASVPVVGYPLSTGSANTNKKFAFEYGYLEARILVPSCDGCWPAFWLLPSDDVWPPEIDIFEFFNTQKDVTAYTSLHWPAANAEGQAFRNDPLRANVGDNYVGTWHTYSVLWTADLLQFYVDGVPGPQYSDPSQIPHEAMYPIVQLAIQSGHHPAPGSTMQVDYMRAWSRTG
jgi:hypothetical protein